MLSEEREKSKTGDKTPLHTPKSGIRCGERGNVRRAFPTSFCVPGSPRLHVCSPCEGDAATMVQLSPAGVSEKRSQGSRDAALIGSWTRCPDRHRPDRPAFGLAARCGRLLGSMTPGRPGLPGNDALDSVFPFPYLRALRVLRGSIFFHHEEREGHEGRGVRSRCLLNLCRRGGRPLVSASAHAGAGMLLR